MNLACECKTSLQTLHLEHDRLSSKRKRVYGPESLSAVWRDRHVPRGTQPSATIGSPEWRNGFGIGQKHLLGRLAAGRQRLLGTHQEESPQRMGYLDRLAPVPPGDL